ncbi:hypothetical protein Tco_1471229, partial [Tanacetum coccineum]
SVMSDSDESGITYMEVSSPYEDLSNIGSPRADDHEITIPEPVHVPGWFDSEVARLLAISSPPASSLYPWSSSPPQIPFPLPPPIPYPPLPLSPPSPVLSAPPPSLIRSLGYRVAMIRMRVEAATTSHSLPLPPPFILSPTRPDAPPPMPTLAPTSLPPLLLPSASRREDGPEVNLPPQERLGIALGPRYEVGESSAALLPLWTGRSGVTQRDMLDMGSRIREMRLLRPYRELYQQIIVDRAISDFLKTDRERREEIRELRAADRTRQQQIIQTLTVMQTLQREMIPLQGLVTTLQGQVTALQGHVMALQGQKMAPKRATRSTPVTTTPAPTAATTTMITNAQLQAMIDQGVSAALAARDATMNGVDSHTLGTGVRGSECVARECTYQDFMKCKPL